MILKQVLFVSSALLIFFQGRSQAQTQNDVRISFVIINAGIDVTGTISATETDIVFDPHDLNNSRIKITASASTIKTGIAMRDSHLQKEDFFNAAKYPLIVVRSRAFRRTGRQKFAATFDLTIKGKTRTIAVDLSGAPEKNAVRYKGHFQMNRLDFDLGERSSILDEIVKVNVEVVL